MELNHQDIERLTCTTAHFCIASSTSLEKEMVKAATDLNKAQSEKIFLEHKTKVSYQGRPNLFGEKFK
jgi:hypothetical protein